MGHLIFLNNQLVNNTYLIVSTYLEENVSNNSGKTSDFRDKENALASTNKCHFQWNPLNGRSIYLSNKIGLSPYI